MSFCLFTVYLADCIGNNNKLFVTSFVVIMLFSFCFLDQELIPSCYLSCLVIVGTTVFKGSLRLHRFKSHQDEIWQECS